MLYLSSFRRIFFFLNFYIIVLSHCVMAKCDYSYIALIYKYIKYTRGAVPPLRASTPLPFPRSCSNVCYGNGCYGNVCYGNGCYGNVCYGNGCYSNGFYGNGCYGNCCYIRAGEVDARARHENHVVPHYVILTINLCPIISRQT